MTTAKLFEANGRPLSTFYTAFALRECVERESVRRLIEANGGELKAKWVPGFIHLEPGAPRSLAVFSRPKDHTVYSLSYIKDATGQHSLPSLDAYTFRFPMVDPIEPDAPKDSYKGRNKFTQAEEDVMTQYMKKYQGSYSSLAYWNRAIEHGLGVERSANTLRDHCKRMLEGKTVAREELRKMEEAKKRESMTPKPVKKPKISDKPSSPPEIQRITSPVSAFSPPKPVNSPSPSPAVTQHRVVVSTPPGVYKAAERSTGKGSYRSLLSSASPRKLSERFENNSELIITVDNKRKRVVTDHKKNRELCLKAHIFEQLRSLVSQCLKKPNITPHDEVEVVKVLLSKRGDVASTISHFA